MAKQIFKRTIADILFFEPISAIGRFFKSIFRGIAYVVSSPYRLAQDIKQGLVEKHGPKISMKIIIREIEITAVLGVIVVLGIGGITSAAAVTAVTDFKPNPEPIVLVATAGQKIVVGDSTAATQITRDSFEVVLNLQTSTSSYTYLDSSAFTNNTESDIQWPFLTGVPISSTFGTREKPCPTCSEEHNGVDFTPGEGSEIQAIASGVVTEVVNFKDNTSELETEENSGGTMVVITHMIDGQEVKSIYCHMQYESSPLKVGDEVGVGALVGKVGNTGKSTGAHLHLSIRTGGEYVDPYAWLKEHVKL